MSGNRLATIKTKTILASILAVAIGLAITGRLMFKPPAIQETARANHPEPVAAPEPAVVPPTASPDPAPTEPAGKPPESAPPRAQPDAAPKVAGPPSQGGKKTKDPLRDPLARAAMSLVGVDPDAGAYWLGAIYDPSLPDQEREDLIEDLNEEGLSDPKHPSPEELPLILNRIEIIGEVAFTADDFMLPHLMEVYKDLVNLAKITQGLGRPVR